MMTSGKIKQKVETYKGKDREENVPSASVVASSNDVKFEMMLKTMDKLMDKMTIENKPLKREKKELVIYKEPIVYKEHMNKINKLNEVRQPTLVDVEKVVSTFNL